jgi:ATP-dependent exoDNAse (exonuclease V) alpha subunit
MAIYSFSLRNIFRQLLPDQKDAGRKPLVRTALAAAAYRAGERLQELDGRLINFQSRQPGIAYTEIFAVEGAPQWALDRQSLWERVEQAETEPNALLARRLIVALPHELTDAQRIQLVHNFVLENFVVLGMVVDLSIHEPIEHKDGSKEDERNYYTHILLTTRTLTQEGFGDKCDEWGEKPLLLRWRERWAAAVNSALESAGIEARVDHRSLKNQGIERKPDKHRGPNRPLNP